MFKFLRRGADALWRKACGIIAFLVMCNIIFSSPLTSSLFEQLNPLVIDQKYKLTTHIKTGGFGSVYSGFNIENNVPVAVKLETLDSKSTLQNEYEMLQKVQGTVGVPEVFCHKELEHPLHGPYQALVMQKLGPSVRSVIRAAGLHTDAKISNLLLFAVQAVDRLETLHNHGILHNDVKPANFLLGFEKNDTDTVYTIDLGIASLFRKGDSDLHVVYSDGHSRAGTLGYQSFHSLLGEAPSRRDDMESLGYSLLSMYPGHELPWAHSEGSNTGEREEATLEMMMRTTLSGLCDGFPVEFTAYFRHVKALGFYEKPNYKYMKALFTGLFERKLKSKMEGAHFIYR